MRHEGEKDGPVLLTIAEAAKLLGESVTATRRRVELGSLPARRFGPKSIRLVRAELLAFIDELPPVSHEHGQRRRKRFDDESNGGRA